MLDAVKLRMARNGGGRPASRVGAREPAPGQGTRIPAKRSKGLVMLYVLIAIAGLAVAGPLFGADSRDGLDWAPGDFWLPRRRTARAVRTAGSPARADGDRAAADRCRRTAPAAG
ncbi:hypothetical protein GCM10022416_05000 [Actinomadura keratinilytica]|jgi:hypothetical protein|uniref:Uncharacterized protein n=1 Tax=Actinomadura keratinilytica TaxID=547461 RepID=A0ABP7Y2Z4_9ACTN